MSADVSTSHVVTFHCSHLHTYTLFDPPFIHFHCVTMGRLVICTGSGQDVRWGYDEGWNIGHWPLRWWRIGAWDGFLEKWAKAGGWHRRLRPGCVFAHLVSCKKYTIHHIHSYCFLPPCCDNILDPTYLSCSFPLQPLPSRRPAVPSRVPPHPTIYNSLFSPLPSSRPVRADSYPPPVVVTDRSPLVLHCF